MAAYRELMAQIEANGYRIVDRIVGPNREVYVRNFGHDGVGSQDLVTEIQVPIAKA